MIRILIILILILGSLAVACSVYSQEAKDGGAELMICFDQNDAKELLKRATEHPILIKENEALREKIANLEEQLKLKEALLNIAEERRKIQIERAELYQKIAESETRLADRYSEMNEKLQKQLERRGLLEKIGITIGIIAGVAIGLAF
jgi:vacuolar-type H+-ATPase subunit I/STV1